MFYDHFHIKFCVYHNLACNTIPPFRTNTTSNSLTNASSKWFLNFYGYQRHTLKRFSAHTKTPGIQFFLNLGLHVLYLFSRKFWDTSKFGIVFSGFLLNHAPCENTVKDPSVEWHHSPGHKIIIIQLQQMLAFSLVTKQRYADIFSQGAELLIWQYIGGIHTVGIQALLSDRCDFEFPFYLWISDYLGKGHYWRSGSQFPPL